VKPGYPVKWLLAVAITFQQSIGRTDALRTGAYSKTLTFTLSTTNP
jgi:amidase